MESSINKVEMTISTTTRFKFLPITFFANNQSKAPKSAKGKTPNGFPLEVFQILGNSTKRIRSVAGIGI